MRKFAIALLVVLVLISFTVSTLLAQGNIVDVASSRDDLSTLVQALEAADPIVAETLGSRGSYTLLAPTNVAFINLASFLDISLEELLANQEVMTQILLYHIVDGQNFSSRFAQLDGQVVPTRLTGAFIGISVSGTGDITFNRIADIVRADVTANNGVIHVIDQTLLNRVITDSLAESAAATTSVPEPTAIPTEVVTEETPENASLLRLIHLAADVPAIDIFANNARVIAGVEYGTMSEFRALAPGTAAIFAVEAGDNVDNAILGPSAVPLRQNASTTIVAIGDAENPQVSVIQEPDEAVEASIKQLVIFNAIPETMEITNDGTLLTRLDLADTFTLNLRAEDDYDLALRVSSDSDEATSTITLDDAPFAAGRSHFVAIAGTALEPTLITDNMGAAVALAVESSTPEATPQPTPTGDLLNIIDTREDLSLLSSAVAAASPEVQEVLSGNAPFTIFAPSDQAIVDLLVTVGISEAQFLSQRDLLDSILLYHVTDGARDTTVITDASGTSVPTLLPGSFIGVTVDRTGNISLNRVVSVVTADVIATNGVLHVVEDVLLPQAALDAFGL